MSNQTSNRRRHRHEAQTFLSSTPTCARSPQKRQTHCTSGPLVEAMESRILLTGLPPGGQVMTPGTTVAARPELAGTVIYDNLIPVSYTNPAGQLVFTGSLQDRVVRETASGTLDFYQALRADLSPTAPPFKNPLFFAQRKAFSGFAADVDWRIDGLGDQPIHPVSASRTSDGSEISFAFGGALISEGQTSFFYFVKTDATNFDLNGETQLVFSPTALILVNSTAEPALSAGKSVIFNFGDGTALAGPQRSEIRDIQLHFAHPVTLDPGAVTLDMLNTGGSGTNDNNAPPTDVSSALGAPRSSDGGSTYIIAILIGLLEPSPFVDQTGSLTDGIYVLTVHADKVMNPAGGPLEGGDQTTTFARLFGDIDGNGAVNNADFFQFKKAFGHSRSLPGTPPDPLYNPDFDFDANGKINNADFFAFKTRFGKKFAY